MYPRISAASVFVGTGAACGGRTRRQMVNVEDILKQQLLGSLEENYFNGQRQAYINYSNRTLAVLIQHIYNDHGTISSIYIEDSE